MGDRISIQFKNKEWLSVVLFSHWDGKGLLKEVEKYYAELKKGIQKSETPLDRLEPYTVMVDFIRHLTKNLKRVESNYHLGCTENDGDNDDNGHFVFDLEKGKWKRT